VGAGALLFCCFFFFPGVSLSGVRHMLGLRLGSAPLSIIAWPGAIVVHRHCRPSPGALCHRLAPRPLRTARPLLFVAETDPDAPAVPSPLPAPLELLLLPLVLFIASMISRSQTSRLRSRSRSSALSPPPPPPVDEWWAAAGVAPLGKPLG
jgi:hypothetical protein